MSVKSPQLPQTVFLAIELLDDAQIVAELQNQTVATWAYTIVAGGKPIHGLSKVGVDEACSRLMGSQRRYYDEELEYAQDPTNRENILFEARVTEFTYALIEQADGSKKSEKVMLSSHIGTKRQWIKMKLSEKNGNKIIDDNFWFEKGSMKAIRNAKKRFISPELEAQIIAEAIKTGKSQTINFDEKKEARQQEKKEALRKNGADKSPADRVKEIFELAKQCGYTSRDHVYDKVVEEFPALKSFGQLIQIVANDEYYKMVRTYFSDLSWAMERESIESEENIADDEEAAH